MTEKKFSSRNALLLLISTWFLFFFAHLWEAELKLDGMTYAAIAKNILITGDWTTLHYSNYIYADFYQHPPFAFWLQAIFFKLFGIGIYSAKAWNGLIALATLLVLLNLTRKLFQSFEKGILATVVLMTSTRWIKFASDFYLDNLLALLLILAFSFVLSFTQSKQPTQRILFAAGYGLCLAASLLTKGMVAFVAPVALICAGVLLLIQDVKSPIAKDFIKLCVFGVLIALVSLLPWLFWGKGVSYLQNYWSTSVAYRLSAPKWQDHLIPIRHLLSVWLPWWPIFIYGTYRLRKQIQQHPFLLLSALHAWGIVIGFSLVGHMIEFYLLPFYVFAAILTNWTLIQWQGFWQRRETLWKIIPVGVWIAALAMATLPIELHSKRAASFQDLIRVAQERCIHSEAEKDLNFQEVLILPKVGYIWHLLAHIQWNTPWQGQFPQALSKAQPQQLLIADQTELPSDGELTQLGWVKLKGLPQSSLKLLQPLNHASCRE